jgi:hypothetical protein
LVLPAIAPAFVSFFRGQEMSCPKCKSTLPSLWEMALRTVREDWTCSQVFQLAGARQTYARALLKPDRVIQLQLARWRIPKTAEILQLKFNALGPAEGPSVLPLQWEPTFEPRPRNTIFIYGATYGRTPTGRAELMLSISWVAPGPDAVSIHHLADAAKQFEARRYPSLVIPANVAVEAALGRALREWIQVFCTDKEIGDFFTKGATYAHQLKVMASVAADTLRMKRLDSEIRARLDLLRGYRNDFGHRGASERPPITKEKAGEFLTAAIFGYHYARYLHAAVKRLRRRRRR